MKKIQKKFKVNNFKYFEILKWASRNLTKILKNKKKINQLNLVIEEVIVNIFQHGKKDKINIDFIFYFFQKKIKIIIVDNSFEFDPKIKKSPMKQDENLFTRKEGGLGILFIKYFIDDLFYKRKNDLNILTLIKYL